MKVILLKDVPKVGRRYELKEVSDGFAANFLFPRGLAEKATPTGISELQKKMEAEKASTEVQEELLKKNFATLKTSSIELARPADEKGHLFAGVRTADISKVINEKLGMSVPEHMIILEHPLKTVGEHDVKIESGENKTNLKVSIVGQ